MDGPPQSQSQPQPAQPASAVATSILASELLNNLLHQRQLRHQCYCERQQGLGGGRLSEIGSDKESAYLRTECKEIDEYVLQGGVQRGSVVGLSAVDEIVGRVVSQEESILFLLASAVLAGRYGKLMCRMWFMLCGADVRGVRHCIG